MTKKSYHVKGMHCASCSTIIVKKLKKIPGVESCEVNFATEKANISFDDKKVSNEDMNNEINKLGYSLTRHNVISNSIVHLAFAKSIDINHGNKVMQIKKLVAKTLFDFFNFNSCFENCIRIKRNRIYSLPD